LRTLLEKAKELGRDIGCISRASVSGEALPNSLREEIEAMGVTVSQTYATADVGLIAYESSAREGMILDEEILVEIVRPGSGDPVGDGEVGEVVVSVLNPDYPLIRFATGDMSAIMPDASPCGRTNRRIKGWMGRADQTTKVKGMFVRPEQVNTVAARYPGISAYRMVVSSENHQDVLTFRCVSREANDDARRAIENTIREVCKLRAIVEFVTSADLPNDGKVIEDARSYE
jgi:phenylacetate-CoA ligase